MLTVPRKFKYLNSIGARARLFKERNQMRFARMKDGVKCFILFVAILCLCSKLKPSNDIIKTTMDSFLLILNLCLEIYKSIILPHFDYCSQVWGCLGKVLSDKLQRLQNRAFRIISREGYETRSKDILNKAGFFDLQTRREQQLAVVMYKIKHKMLPNYLQDIFVSTQQVHYHNTRQRECNYALSMPNTNAMKKSFGYRGAETWNNLPTELKSQKGLSTFKSKIKQLQIDK